MAMKYKKLPVAEMVYEAIKYFKNRPIGELVN